MKPKRESDIVILPLNHRTVDVFTGKGWDNWSRFEITPSMNPNRDKYLKLVAGQNIFSSEYGTNRSNGISCLSGLKTNFSVYLIENSTEG